MRLSIMSRFMEIEGSVIRRGRIIPSEKAELFYYSFKIIPILKTS